MACHHQMPSHPYQTTWSAIPGTTLPAAVTYQMPTFSSTSPILSRPHLESALQFQGIKKEYSPPLHTQAYPTPVPALSGSPPWGHDFTMASIPTTMTAAHMSLSQSTRTCVKVPSPTTTVGYRGSWETSGSVGSGSPAEMINYPLKYSPQSLSHCMYSPYHTQTTIPPQMYPTIS